MIYITYTFANPTQTIMSMVVRRETQGRYVPPHKRGEDYSMNEVGGCTCKSRNFCQSGTGLEIVKRNRRRDLSKRSKFNTKSESPSGESPKAIRAIEVPIAVAPPIVESPLTTDFLNQEDVILQGLNPYSIV